MKRVRKATLKDVAHLAGVSTVTVSNVINQRPNVSEKTRARVEQAIRELGYTANLAARSLAGGRTQTVGMLVPDLTTQFVGEIVRGTSDELRAVGMEMLISTASDIAREQQQVAFLQSLTDGLLLILPQTPDRMLLAVEQAGVPVVVIDHRGQQILLPSVDVDNYTGARQAMAHLLELGHRRIGYVAGPKGFGASAARLKGYKEALATAGLPFDKSLVVQGTFQQPSGFAAGQHLFSLPQPPTAVFAANDLMAFGVMEAAKQMGLRIPEDVSIVGFDDIPQASQVYPPLTTIRQPLYQMGVAAARLLVAMLRGVRPPTSRITLSTELVVRSTTARAKEVMA
ncbi:MAG: LacI family transcriptional regulator [Meiothermus sp.]|uniref:LacI family DNA-binding transcriptional regulator n=1 Tax=Meiothermus sp. TaxID=1955249 RepID=UPI0025EC3F75|nr:LacI family DNA-binding transcriptional regulator [Meiothermus sp.]MCS7058762.1 LacI family transcriptional regulator [Meiothermus sp.]MCS7195381.1 LacI family transcriptional regulator [Meiothermus sp.]MDW8091018.1 LacI family DNA-binding transcriptional regulator [Meiothermus sp.]MDW8482237.1 LacI family DNA-binding transcriptional regulator [Meiothermus sp.]